MQNKFKKCDSCISNKSNSEECKACDGSNNYGELFNADPNCKHNIVCASGGGIKCTKCNGWFCY